MPGLRRFSFEISTDGNTDIINLMPQIHDGLRGADEGLAHIFVAGSTAAITTIEFEPGLVKHDVPAIFQRLVPDDAAYDHEQTWNDDNGHSHLRAALIGPGIVIPFAHGRLLTGEYQQVVLMDFDTRPRRRNIIVTIVV